MSSAVNQTVRYAMPLFLACALASCSGGVGSPEQAVRKMVRAHGGDKQVARLQTFVGKGFIKDLSSRTVAESFAFDIYRKGPLYKHKITKAPRGTITNVLVLYYDGTTCRQWMNGAGIVEMPPLEVGILRYRFPNVLQWAQEPGRAGELLPADKSESVVRVRYKDGTSVLTLALDKKSWLLSGVEVRDLSDSTFVFNETYEHYFDLDGNPFPASFKATLKSSPYYEFILPTVELKAELPDSLFRVTAQDTSAFVKPAAAEQPSPKR